MTTALTGYEIDQVRALINKNPDFHGRRITNAGPSQDDLDYVVRKELFQLFGGKSGDGAGNLESSNLWKYSQDTSKAIVPINPTTTQVAVGSENALQYIEGGLFHFSAIDEGSTDSARTRLGVGHFNNAEGFGSLSIIRGLGTQAVPLVITDGKIIGDYDWRGQFGTTIGQVGIGAKLRGVADGSWAGGAFTEDDVQIGGDSLNSGWTSSSIRTVVKAMATDDTNLFACPSQTGGHVYSSPLSSISWTEITPSWGATTTVRAAFVYNGFLYVGRGNTSTNNLSVWQRDISGGTWVEIGTVTDLGSPTNDQLISDGLADTVNDKLYFTTEGTRAQVWEYDVAGDTWTKVGEETTDFPALTSPSKGADGIGCCAIDETNGILYVAVRYFGSSQNEYMIYQYTIATDTWLLIGGRGTNGLTSPVTSTTTSQSMVFAFDGLVWAVTDTADTTGGGYLYYYDPSDTSWTRIGGDGTLSGWSGNQCREIIIQDVDTKIVVGIVDENGDVEVWEYDVTSNPKAGTWTQTYTFAAGYNNIESFTLTSAGVLSIGMGQGVGDGDVWQLGTFGGGAFPTAVELYVTRENTSSNVLTMKWDANGDIRFGGSTIDGVEWIEAERKLSVENFRIVPAALPGSPEEGDLVPDSGDSNYLKARANSEWFKLVGGPSSVTDEDVTIFDGTAGNKIQSGGARVNFVGGAGRWEPLVQLGPVQPTVPEFIMAPDGDIVAAWIPTA